MVTLRDLIGEDVATYEIEYRIHATRRMFQRGIFNEDIETVLDHGQIIEEYEEAPPFQHVLISGRTRFGRKMDRRLLQEKIMSCAICRRGNLESGSTTVVLERGDATVIFKDVPARVCDTCGEEYVSAEVNESLLRRAEEAMTRGATLEMLRFAA